MELSKTLQAVGPVTPDLTPKFIKFWKRVGFLPRATRIWDII